jgi:hypothetical protein
LLIAGALVPNAPRARRGDRVRIGEESMKFAGERKRLPKARSVSNAAVVAILTVALLAAGCATSSGKTTPDDVGIPEANTAMSSVQTSVVAVAPVVDVAPETAITRAVDAFWVAYLAAHDPPNPDHPSLTDVAVGEELALLKERISMRRSVGESIRRSERDAFTSTVRIRSLTAENSIVEVCAFDDFVIVDILSGRVVNDEVGTYRFEMSMVKQDGRWLVGSNRIISYRLGVDTCER